MRVRGMEIRERMRNLNRTLDEVEKRSLVWSGLTQRMELGGRRSWKPLRSRKRSSRRKRGKIKYEMIIHLIFAIKRLGR